MWLNRTLCSVLEEMRKAYETRNFSYLSGLIEEAQSMGNRMESAIEDVNDIERLHKKRKKLHKEVDELQEKVESLQDTLGIEPQEKDILDGLV